MNNVEKASVIYSNSGNLIIPIISALFGKEWILYTSAYISVQMIFFWIHGKNLLSGETKMDFFSVLTNINFLAIILGILFFCTGIKLPAIVNEALGSVADMIGPLYMVIAGVLLGKVDFKEIFTCKRIYMVSFFRMILYPIFPLILLKTTILNTWFQKVLLFYS